MEAIFCRECKTLIPLSCAFAGRRDCPRPIACPWAVPEWQWGVAFICMGPRQHFAFPCAPVVTTGWVMDAGEAP
jgi:hypothetical protein